MNTVKLLANPLGLRLIAAAGFAAVCSTSVMAQSTPGFYLGGNVGATRADFNNDAYNNLARNNGFAINSSSTDKSSAGGKLFGGYQFNPNFALEGGYFDLGRFNYSGVTSGGTYNGNTRSHGLNLDLVGTLPLSDKFSVLGRVGAAYAKTRDSSSSTFAPPSTANRSSNDTNVKYGLGLQYAITDALSLRGEIERYHRINDPIRRSNVDMVSIGLVYRFGAKAQTPVAQTYVAPAPVYVAPPPPVVAAPAPAPYVAPPPPPYVAPVRPAKEGRN